MATVHDSWEYLRLPSAASPTATTAIPCLHQDEASWSPRAAKPSGILCSPRWAEQWVPEAAENVFAFLFWAHMWSLGYHTCPHTEVCWLLALQCPPQAQKCLNFINGCNFKFTIFHFQDGATKFCWRMSWTMQACCFIKILSLGLLRAPPTGLTCYCGLPNVKFEWKSMYSTSHT